VPQTDRTAGVDEAGRGPLAGPVVAAAVVLASGKNPPTPLRDSKTLTLAKREILFDWIFASGADVGIGILAHDEVDRLNILRASLEAMRVAVGKLSSRPDLLLIDGTFTIDMPDIRQEAIVKGDSKIAAISAASIIAKVTRDRIMDEYHGQYPQYGFDKHKGYPTAEHKRSIIKHGPCPIHRLTFRGVKDVRIPENL
jgi:ribonuclease HII